MKLFFDTETTGLVRFDLPEDDSRQPRLVQISCLLTTDTGRIVNQFGTLVKPTDFEIPQEATAVHGISTEMAAELGMDLGITLSIANRFLMIADEHIAHNIKFDIPVVAAELARIGMILDPRPRFCTMLACTAICKLPHTNPRARGGYKWPKCEEAYEYFFHEKLVGSHDALTDVMACKRIYFEGLKVDGHLKNIENRLNECSIPADQS